MATSSTRRSTWALPALATTLCIGCTRSVPPEAFDAGVQPMYVPGADGGFEIVLPARAGSLDIEVGVPDAETGIQFAELTPGGPIPFAGVGQSGLTARVGLRVHTPSREPLPNAIVQVDITRVDDTSIRPAMNRLRDSATNLRCDAEGACIYAPLHLQITHLNSLPSLEGTVVTVKTRIIDPNDPSAFGTAWNWGVLSPLE